MASTSEQTYGNRLQHGRDLATALTGITGYKPDNTDLTAANLDALCDEVEQSNTGVAVKSQVLSDQRKLRRTAYFGDAKTGVPGLATLAGRVRDGVGAMPGGKKSTSYPRIQKLTQKISGYKAPKKPVSSSPGQTPDERRKVSQSEASYGSLVQHGRDLAAAVSKVAGYNPGFPELAPEALAATMKTLSEHNDTVTKALMDADSAIKARSKMYEQPETGLRARFQQAKAAVATQFGRRSAEYKSIASLRY